MITAEIGEGLRIRTTLSGNAVLPANRKNFNYIVAFVQQRGLDGVDFDENQDLFASTLNHIEILYIRFQS